MTFQNGKVYISPDFEKGTRYIFSISRDDNRPNVMMLKALKQYSFWKHFEMNFILRKCLF